MEVTSTEVSLGLKSFDCNGKTYFIVTKFHADKACDVTITNGGKCWKHRLDSEDIDAFAKETGMDFEEYVSKMKNALQEEEVANDTAEGLEFDFNVNSAGKSEFKWKTVKNDIKFCLGSMLLSESPTETEFVQILSLVSQEMQAMKKTIAISREENDSVQTRYIQVVKTLENCTQLKQKMENDLILKFALLINEKKAKIRKLMAQNQKYAEAIQQLQERVGMAPEPVEQPSTSRGFSREKPLRKMSSSSSDTDDACPVIIKRKNPAPAPPPKVLPVSPIKPMEPSTSTASGLSDIAMTTSSDSTVDINEMIDDM